MILKETDYPQVQTIAGCLNAQYQQNDTLTVYSASRMPSIKNPFTYAVQEVQRPMKAPASASVLGLDGYIFHFSCHHWKRDLD